MVGYEKLYRVQREALRSIKREGGLAKKAASLNSTPDGSDSTPAFTFAYLLYP